MYHSIKSIKELQSLDPKQQQLILAISGSRLWKAGQRWRIFAGMILFQGILPIGGFYLFGYLLHDALTPLAVLMVLVIIGAKIQYHFQITWFMPHIRDLVANGIRDDDLATLASVRKRPMGKTALMSGLGAGILFACVMQLAMGFIFSWHMMAGMALFFGLAMGLMLYFVLKLTVKRISYQSGDADPPSPKD